MRLLRSIFVFLLCVSLVFLLLFWNNCVIVSEEVKISLQALPTSFDNLRIAVLADLHGREFEKENSYLLTSVRELSPDIICICGDLFDEASDLAMLKPLIVGLSDIAPTFYVTGNHEWQLDNLQNILLDLESYGATVLQNEYVVLESNGEKIVLAGVNDPCGPYDQKTPEELVTEIRQNEGSESVIIMLSHRNDQMDLWAGLGVDLVLSGHCHGGVVRLPFLGGVFGTNRELFPDYDAGLYSQEKTNLYVSRGLGYTNVRLRLFNRPHLPLLILQQPTSS